MKNFDKLSYTEKNQMAYSFFMTPYYCNANLYGCSWRNWWR